MQTTCNLPSKQAFCTRLDSSRVFQRHYPQPSSQQPGIGFPEARFTDKASVSDKEIIKLYQRRWDVETDFRALKCSLSAGILTCRSADTAFRAMLALFSGTTDIEGSLVTGAHGPDVLHIVVIAG